MKGQGSALLSRFPLREGAHGGTTGENARAIDGGKLIRASFWPSGWRQWPEWPKVFRFTAAGRVLAVVPFVSKKHERYPVLALLALFIRAGISFCSYRLAKNMTGRACRCDCCDSTSCGVLVAFCPSQAA